MRSILTGIAPRRAALFAVCVASYGCLVPSPQETVPRPRAAVQNSSVRAPFGLAMGVEWSDSEYHELQYARQLHRYCAEWPDEHIHAHCRRNERVGIREHDGDPRGKGTYMRPRTGQTLEGRRFG